MSIISWVLVGLLAGFLAKWIIPTPRHKGFLKTMVLGVVGGVLGGFVGQKLGFSQEMTGLDQGSILTATIGALSILILQRFFAQK